MSTLSKRVTTAVAIPLSTVPGSGQVQDSNHDQRDHGQAQGLKTKQA